MTSQEQIEAKRREWVEGMSDTELQGVQAEAKRIAFDRYEDFARRQGAYESLQRLEAEAARRGES